MYVTRLQAKRIKAVLGALEVDIKSIKSNNLVTEAQTLLNMISITLQNNQEKILNKLNVSITPGDTVIAILVVLVLY